MSDEPNTRSPGPGLLMIISGPSGVGKTTLIERLNEKFDFTFSVSATTRQRTEHETEGIDYYFLDEPTFEQWVDEDKFLEHACVFGRYWYGTPKEPIEKNMADGRIVLLDIDVQGAEIVKKAASLNARFLFVSPPSVEELEKRLRGRGTEKEESIAVRMANATKEMAKTEEPGFFDLVIVNDNLEKAYEEMKTFILP